MSIRALTLSTALMLTVTLATGAATNALAGGRAAEGNCGLIKVGSHHYLVLAYKVSCSFAEKTATKLIPLRPKPLAPGGKAGSLPSPKGYKCIATLSPGNSKLQLSGGCSKSGAVLIQWQRAN